MGLISTVVTVWIVTKTGFDTRDIVAAPPHTVDHDVAAPSSTKVFGTTNVLMMGILQETGGAVKAFQAHVLQIGSIVIVKVVVLRGIEALSSYLTVNT